VAIDGGRHYRSRPLTERSLRAADVVVIVTDHSSYDYEFIVRHAACIVDTRNATRAVEFGRDKVRKL
jgi:UDP-N-acetyl-D-glucosamine dehydrogenase